VQHAEDIYNRLEESYRQGKTDVIPNTIVATSIIDAWSQSGDANAGAKAENLLNKLNRLFEDYRDENMRPNVLSYTATINTIAKARQFGKAAKAQMLLNRMIDLYKAGDNYVKPTVHTFTAVINACAYTLGDSSEKRKAFEIATSVFKSMSEYAQPNEITYGTFLKACSNLIPKGQARDSSILSVFKHCCGKGRVSNKILDLMETTLSRDQFEKVLKSSRGIDGVFKPPLPPEWSCNLEKSSSNRTRPILNR
jgi:DNA-binding phage protein